MSLHYTLHSNHTIDAKLSEQKCAATESPACAHLTDITLVLRSMKYEGMRCDIENASERWSDLAGSLVVGGIPRWCTTALFLPSISVLPPAFVRPRRVQLARLPDSFCNEYIWWIPSLWNMMDEGCRKRFTFIANAFPLTQSHNSVCLYFAF